MVSFVFFRISTLFLCCHYRPTSILAYIQTKCKQIVSYFSFFIFIPVISVSLTILGQLFACCVICHLSGYFYYLCHALTPKPFAKMARAVAGYIRDMHSAHWFMPEVRLHQLA